MRNKSLDIGKHVRDGLLRRITQTEPLESELLLDLKKGRFSNQEFATGTFVSKI